MAINMDLTKLYNFTPLGTSLLGGERKNMRLTDIVGIRKAMLVSDVVSLNKSLESLIDGLSVRADDNTYLIFRDQNDIESVFAYEWIDAGTISEVTSFTGHFYVYNMSDGDLVAIKALLKSAGFTSVEGEIV